MRPWARRAWLIAAALLLGGLAFLGLGDGPGSQAGTVPTHVDWRLPAAPAQELAAADGVWVARAPWGAPPKPVDAIPPPPPPIPVGVVASGKAFRAVFVTLGGPEVRVKAGDALPDGGRVTAVSRFHVSWIDGQGTKHEQELLADPLPTQNPIP